MLESFYEWMDRMGRRLTKAMLLRLGWIASGAGLALLVSLWLEGSDDLVDWFEGCIVLCGRPFAGWIVSRADSMEPPPE
jgi:hypothetical protein